MPAPKDLVHMTATTTGTGNLTVAAVNGKQAFGDASAFGTGGVDVFDYFISNRNAAEWERGTGHMSDATTLVRDTVLASSNSNAAVSFSAGTKDVTNDVPAGLRRELLSTTRNYYVSTTGNDSNTGKTSTKGTVTFTNGSSAVGWTAHGRSVGDNIMLSTSGGLPTNFSATAIYYVKTVTDANTIVLSLTSGGAAVSAGSAGSGTHTATVLSPFLTIQKAVDTVAALDASIYSVGINVANGTYTGNVTLKSFVGAGAAVLQGDVTTPSNVLISTTSADCVNMSAVVNSWTVTGFKFQTTTSGMALAVINGSRLTVGPVEFGAVASGYYHVYANNGAFITLSSNYTISGSAGRHWDAEIFSLIQAAGITITLTGTPAFSTAFAFAYRLGMMVVYGDTFVGSATGARYNSQLNSVIDVNGGGATYLPGNSAGSIATGGVYN